MLSTPAFVQRRAPSFSVFSSMFHADEIFSPLVCVCFPETAVTTLDWQGCSVQAESLDSKRTLGQR